MTSVLAIDLGGSSGRAVLGKITKAGKLELKEVNRFGSYLINNEDKITWDINLIMKEIHKSLEIAEKIAPNFVSIGVDTWGVDFGLLINGKLEANPRAYRDPYTKGQIAKVTEKVSLAELYEITGIQPLEMNTLFQLTAYKELGILHDDHKVLLMPDLINYLLTDVMKAETTIASTTQLINVKKKEWSQELLAKLGLPQESLPELVKAGTIVGELKEETMVKYGLPGKKVIAVGSHDTASAVFSIPDPEHSYFLSSGTWSLLGVQTNQPYINEASKKYHISHEQGVNDTYLLLKNITGLWLIEEAKRDLAAQGLIFDYAEIATLARTSQSLNFYFDSDLPELALPGEFLQKLKAYGERTNQQVPKTPGEIFRVIYENLALKYRKAFEELEATIGEKREKLYIVGGGSNAEILCQYTANVLNKEVYAGMSEGTAVGNILNQLVALEEITLAEKDALVTRSFEFKNYLPQEVADWEEKYSNYKKKVEAV